MQWEKCVAMSYENRDDSVMTKVALVQLDVSDTESVQDRISRAESIIGSITDVDLIVLPELWHVGAFDLEQARSHAETLDGQLVTRMRAAAPGRMLHMGSFAELRGGNRYNTAVLIDEGGEILATYRKIHLFGWAEGEPSVMTAGDTCVVLPTPLGATGLATCYDLRFPEMFRRLLDSGAESFLIDSGWPSPRINHWTVLAQARAIENQAWVIACNSAGTHAGVEMGGSSIVVDPRGTVVAQAGIAEEVLVVEVDVDLPQVWRRQFPVLSDRVL
jgi:predicted amidohydrolase